MASWLVFMMTEAGMDPDGRVLSRKTKAIPTNYALRQLESSRIASLVTSLGRSVASITNYRISSTTNKTTVNQVQSFLSPLRILN